ncbi:amino acid ABC transporter permease [Neisseriaceae bacterium CLB008]
MNLVTNPMLAGLDWAYIAQTLPLYQQALLLTFNIALVGIACALIIGAACSVIVHYKIKGLSPIVAAYVALFRNTPLLIQLFFMFYALPKIGLKLSPELIAVIGLALLGGSYMAEAFKGGIAAVAKSQQEAGLAIGLNRWQLMRYVVLPQALSYSVPAIGANCIFLLKETSLFSVIAVMDLMNVTRSQIGMFYQTNEALFMLVLAYAILLIPLSWLLSLLERKVRHAEFGH